MPADLPRTAPSFRFQVERVAYSLEPAFLDGALVVANDARADGRGPLWTAYGTDGAVLARGLPPGDMPVEWSNAGVAPDGTIALLVFQSMEEGIHLQCWDRSGRFLGSAPTGFEYARSSGPEWYEGPGPMYAPRPAPEGTWIVYAGESTADRARDQLACVRPGLAAPIWRRDRHLLGVAAGLAISSTWRGEYAAHDLATGAERWEQALGEGWVEIAGERLVLLRERDGQIVLASIHAATGASQFERTFPRQEGNLAPGPHRASERLVIFQNWHDGLLHVIGPSGETIDAKPFPHSIAAFDGVQVLVSADLPPRALSCGPIADPGAWAWTVELPERQHAATQVFAKNGWLCVTPSGSRKAWIFAP